MTVDHIFENTARWPTFLFLLFIGMKLAGCLLLPWWLVASPLWMPVAALWLIALTALGTGEVLAYLHRSGFKRYSRAMKKRGIV